MTKEISKRKANMIILNLLKQNEELHFRKPEDYIRSWHQITQCELVLDKYIYNILYQRIKDLEGFVNFKDENVYNRITSYNEIASDKALARGAVSHYDSYDNKILKRALFRSSPMLWLKDYHIFYKYKRTSAVVGIIGTFFGGIYIFK